MPMSRSAWEDSTNSGKEQKDQPDKKESTVENVRKRILEMATPAPIKKLNETLDKAKK